MLTDYIRAALRRADYEILPDGEGYFGSIRGFRGVWANAPSLESCRDELRRALEEWIVIRLRHRLELPVIDRMNLNERRTRKRKVA